MRNICCIKKDNSLIYVTCNYSAGSIIIEPLPIRRITHRDGLNDEHIDILQRKN